MRKRKKSKHATTKGFCVIQGKLTEKQLWKIKVESDWQKFKQNENQVCSHQADISIWQQWWQGT